MPPITKVGAYYECTWLGVIHTFRTRQAAASFLRQTAREQKKIDVQNTTHPLPGDTTMTFLERDEQLCETHRLWTAAARKMELANRQGRHADARTYLARIQDFKAEVARLKSLTSELTPTPFASRYAAAYMSEPTPAELQTLAAFPNRSTNPTRGETPAEETSMYALYQAGYAIYGVGASPDEAKADAREWLDADTDLTDIPTNAGHGALSGTLCLQRCTARLADAVRLEGGDQFYRTTDNGILDLDDEDEERACGPGNPADYGDSI